MKIEKWAVLLLMVAPLLSGCKDFWENTSSSFTLTNSGDITVSPGVTGTSTITVTPTDSFTGTVTLTCSVTSTPSSAANPTTCSLSSSSVTISDTTAKTSTLSAVTETGTTAGAYDITVTGVSDSISKTTTVCVEVTSGSCATASTSGNFYLLNDGTTNGSKPAIVGKSIKSGALSGISGSPWSLSTNLSIGGTPHSMAIAPNGKFLLVSTTDGVYTCLITGGVLETGVKVTSEGAYAIQINQIDSSDSWLIEALQGDSSVTLNAIPISSTTGKYTSGGTTHSVTIGVTNADVQPNRMVLSPDNDKVFVALGQGGTIVVPFDKGTPFPSGVSHTLIPLINSAGSALSVAVDPSSRLFYIGETSAIPSTSSGTTTYSGGLRVFTYASSSSSSLVNVSGSPIASGGLAPNFILPEASGNYVYVANGKGASTAGNITGFAITKNSDSTYAISAGSTVAAAIQPVGLAEDSNDTYILAVSKTENPYLDAYTFDSTTGELSSQITSNDTSDASIAVVMAP
jgi:hypothetical protein